jgi:hypothetical protein
MFLLYCSQFQGQFKEMSRVQTEVKLEVKQWNVRSWSQWSATLQTTVFCLLIDSPVVLKQEKPY